MIAIRWCQTHRCPALGGMLTRVPAYREAGYCPEGTESEQNECDFRDAVVIVLAPDKLAAVADAIPYLSGKP